MRISFVLTGEGSSDLRLVEHIQSILIDEGFSEVQGEAPDLGLFPTPIGRTVKEKITALFNHYPHTDVIFVHRDADNVKPEAREKEVFDAASVIDKKDKVIPIIPITMIETWLLTDQDAIKLVAGKKGAKDPIKCIPSLQNLEGVRDSKNLLLEALCEASAAEGGKLRKFKKLFPEMRARLLFELNPAGQVNKLSSYASFREKIRTFAKQKLEAAS